jgi:hypothetical protein
MADNGMITVTLKLFGGIHIEAKIEGYDMSAGIRLSVKKGTRLKSIVKLAGIIKPSSKIYFINGERAGLWARPGDNTEVSCFNPSAGG